MFYSGHLKSLLAIYWRAFCFLDSCLFSHVENHYPNTQKADCV